MNDIEARLRVAAFGTDLAVSDAVLAAALAGAPRSRWLAAVVLGARGHYARAAAALEGLLGCQDRVIASLAASTLASHRRQLGGHANARTLDAAALREVGIRAPGLAAADLDGIDAPGAVSDALLGLAADALALGRQGEARTLLRRVAADTGACWRTRVRQAWVSAEVELAAGDPAAARPHAERAVTLAREHGGSRHVLKSELVLAATLGAEQGGGTLAGAVFAEAWKLGLLPLAWSAALILADADADADVTNAANGRSQLRQEAGSIVHALLLRSDPLGRGLAIASPWVPGVG